MLSRKAAQRSRKVQAVVGALAFAIAASLLGWLNLAHLTEQWRRYTVTRPYMQTQIRPYLLGATREQALKPGGAFKECASECPEMIVVPAGAFLMGLGLKPAKPSIVRTAAAPGHDCQALCGIQVRAVIR